MLRYCTNYFMNYHKNYFLSSIKYTEIEKLANYILFKSIILLRESYESRFNVLATEGPINKRDRS